MSEFDKYLNKNFDSGLGDPSIYILRHTFEAGAQSKQDEIDEYKEVAESMEDAYLREKAKVDELQKQLDKIKELNNERK